MPTHRLATCLVLALAGSAGAAAPMARPAPARLEVQPPRLSLAHADDSARLVVTAVRPASGVSDRTRSAAYSVADPSVVQIGNDGVVRPKKAGSTTITVRDGELTLSVPVEVKSAASPTVSFANDVMPLLARYGCNAGACHGSASGKKGFKVSLLGYDPAKDHETLTRGAMARRLDHLDPAKSLLILKPTGAALHEGGKRFDPGSEAGEVLRRWVAEGAKSDLAAAPSLTGIEVFPAFRTYHAPGGAQQLLVRATYSDGRVRDVTASARYSSNNESAAMPNETGLVALPNRGEAAVMVRYGSFVAVSNLVVLRHDPSFVWSNPPEVNLIDRHVFAKLRAIQTLPSDLCTDEQFLRRVSYDLAGLPPTPDEVRAFLADTDPNKRAKKIEALLECEEHAEFWAGKWADLLRLRQDTSGDKGTWSVYRWLRDAIAANVPYDRFVRDLIAAEGSTEHHAPATYYRVFNTTEDAVEATAQIFLGIRLMCARCHDHPFEKWVQKDYYGVAAFFSQIGRKPGRGQGEQIIFRQSVAAKARHPVSGELLDPKYLDGASIVVGEKQDGRKLLAAWLTAKDNPFFARAAVNRVWSQVFARGIIDPVDDVRSSNPPSNPALLDALAKDFADNGFDVRRLLRMICSSRTYQLSSKTNNSNAADLLNFSHAVPRRLVAEQLVDTISIVTGVRETFRNRNNAASVSQPSTGLRAAQIPDRSLTCDLLDLYGRPRGETSCTCERTNEANLGAALHLIGSSPFTSKIQAPTGAIARLAQVKDLTDEKLTEEAFLRVLCRLPTQEERVLVLKYLRGKQIDNTKPNPTERVVATQDLFWALLNSREFLYNH